MTIKRGSVVSHTGAHECGAGKVLEVTDVKATIQFSDGITRKIASSHYMTLHRCTGFFRGTYRWSPERNVTGESRAAGISESTGSFNN